MRINYNYAIFCIEDGREKRYWIVSDIFAASDIDEARDHYWKVIGSFPKGENITYELHNIKKCKVM